MKVLLINGSPHAKGCTFTALNEVAASLENLIPVSRYISTASFSVVSGYAEPKHNL